MYYMTARNLLSIRCQFVKIYGFGSEQGNQRAMSTMPWARMALFSSPA